MSLADKLANMIAMETIEHLSKKGILTVSKEMALEILKQDGVISKTTKQNKKKTSNKKKKKTTPTRKKNKDGTFAKPRGRAPKGKDWDAAKGEWVEKRTTLFDLL